MIEHQEKIIFLLSCLISISIFCNFFGDKPFTTANYSNESSENVNLTGVMENSMIFVKEYEQYSPKNSRQPFRPISEKKKMLPEIFPLPVWKSEISIFMPTFPRPNIIYWQRFSQDNMPGLSSDMIRTTSSILEILRKEPEVKLSTLSIDLKSQVRINDSIVFKNGLEYQGKILHETEKEIIITTKNQNLSASKENIIKLVRRQNLLEVLQNYWQKVNNDPKSLIDLLVASQELEVEDFTANYFPKLLERFPDVADVYLAFGQYLEKKIQIEQAYQIYLLGQQKCANIDSLKIAECNILTKIGLDEKAIGMLLTISKPQSWFYAMKIAAKNNNWKKIAEILGYFKTQYDVSTQDQIFYWQAQYALYQGNLEECDQLCQKIRTPTAEVYNLQAVSLFLQKKTTQAVSFLEKAISLGESWALYNLALVYYASGAKEQAIEILEKIVLDQPAVVAAPAIPKTVLGYWLYQKNPQDKIFESWIKAGMAADSKEIWTLYLAAECAESSQSMLYYQKILELNFDFSLPFLKLASLALQNNQITDSKNYLEQAKNRLWQPNQNADLEAGLAQSYLLQKEIVIARKHLELAFQIMPNHVHSLKLRAWIYNQENLLTESINDFETILLESPKDEYSQKNKALIMQNKNLVSWEDAFSRVDGPVRRRWQEIAQDGIEISLRNQKVQFSGMNLKGNVPSLLGRSVEPQSLFLFQSDVESKDSNRAFLGIWYGQWENEAIYFGKTNDGKIGYTYSRSGRLENWNAISIPGLEFWPKNLSVVLGIRPEGNQFILFLGQQPIAQVASRNIGKAKAQVGMFAFANSGQNWQAYFDNAKIVEITKK